MITVKVSGAREVAGRMRRRRSRLKDMRPTNKKAAILLFQWVQRNFDAEGGKHDGAGLKWPQLAESTKRRRRGGPPFRILQDTGQLRGRWNITATKQTGRLKSMQDYSGKHERGEGNVPKRKILPEIQHAQRIVFPVYKRHVKVAIR